MILSECQLRFYIRQVPGIGYLAYFMRVHLYAYKSSFWFLIFFKKSISILDLNQTASGYEPDDVPEHHIEILITTHLYRRLGLT